MRTYNTLQENGNPNVEGSHTMDVVLSGQVWWLAVAY